jgi:hypothetical protein
MAYDATIAAITLAGSALSTLATACVLVCFVVYNKNQRSLRHALVLNLALSDFINSLTNTVSGSIYMRDHELVASAACTFNGWIEQLSVQATDFSILAISIATLLVIRKKARLVQVSGAKTVLICLSAWFIPLITSTTATAMGEMKPVSGNWCWISKSRTDLRYGLTHGWRFAIILITIGIYSYVWWYVSRHFRSLGGLYGSTWSSRMYKSFGSEHTEDKRPHETENALEPITVSRQFRIKESDIESQASNTALVLDDMPAASPSSNDTLAPPKLVPHPEPKLVPNPLGYRASISAITSPFRSHSEADDNIEHSPAAYVRNKARQAERDVKRALLMNGYPIMYVILWIPGLTNRILEATGSNSSRVLAILQCSTQFIGFANSVTYGLSGIWRAGR